MLARHADDLFWSARYLDRMETTARLLDVTTHSYGGAPDETMEALWRLRLDALLVSSDNYGRPYDLGGISRTLISDTDNPSSLVRLVTKARETARAIREHLSTEVWEGINLLFLNLDQRDLDRDRRERFFELVHSVKSSCQAISGAAYETMDRDAPWRFFALGRTIERASFSTRFLRAYRDASDARGVFDQQVLLRSLGAFEGFVRHHNRQPTFEAVVEFAMFSRSFPNSLLASLERVEEQLDSLRIPGETSRPRQLAGMLRSGLEYRGLVERRESPAEALEEVHQGLRTLSEAVRARFFSGEGARTCEEHPVGVLAA